MNIVMFNYYIEPKVIPDFLTEDEIEYIKKESINTLTPSGVFDDLHGEYHHDIGIRNCESTWIKFGDPIVDSVVRRCVGLTNKPFINCEDLQVTRYKPGGFYAPHQDIEHDSCTNRRLYTILMVLNDDYEGGETIFPNLDIKYKLKKGDALFFQTTDNHEQKTRFALHCGLGVKSGEKWICNLWVHKYPYA
jgi:hypothetical protein|tara:strand:- start:10 stop:582 length:573 start_codon:yes stop_codon:yes gene_type:complete